MSEPALLQPMGLGELFLRSVRIYLRNLPLLLALEFIILLPGLIVSGVGGALVGAGQNASGLILLLLGFLLEQISLFYFYAAATLVVSLSDIGLKAGIVQILRRIGGKIGIRLLGTVVLQMLVVYAGIILLIIPGLIWGVRYAFAQPVVVLEDTAFRGALRRSRQLGEGSWWRVFWGLMLAFLALVIAWLLAIGSMSLLIALLTLGRYSFVQWVPNIAMLVVLPMSLTYVVLLYHDLRVRKEGFGSEPPLREAV